MPSRTFKKLKAIERIHTEPWGAEKHALGLPTAGPSHWGSPQQDLLDEAPDSGTFSWASGVNMDTTQQCLHSASLVHFLQHGLEDFTPPWITHHYSGG